MEPYYWFASILFIFILTAISSLLIQEKSRFVKCVVPATVAVLSFILLPYIDMIFEKMSEPQVEISTRLMAEKGRIEIGINVTRNPITSAVLDFSFHGIIKDFEEITPIVDVIAKRIGENNIDNVNRLKLETKRINPLTNLKYIICYDPQPGYPVPTTDRYEFSYNWEYRGKVKNKTIWQWSFSDKKASPPPDIHGKPFNLSMEIPNKAIDFEMRNWYKNNIRERRLN